MTAKGKSGVDDILRNTPIPHAMHVKLGIDTTCLCRKFGWLSGQPTDEQIAVAVAGFPDHTAVCTYMTEVLGVRRHKIRSTVTDDDREVVTLYEGDEKWHDGPGWYYVIDDYPDEGSCGAFKTKQEAIEHAERNGSKVSNP